MTIEDPTEETVAFRNAPVALCVSRNRIITTCNDRFAEIFRSDMRRFHGLPLLKLYPTTDDYERIGLSGLQAMRETGRFSDERVMRRLGGDLFWCQVAGRSLSPGAPFNHAIWSFTDLSTVRPLVALTRREREVATMTCQGMTSKQIGEKLGVSYRTVELYRSQLLAKFDARNTAELVAKFTGLPT